MKRTKGFFIFIILIILVVYLYTPKIYQSYRTLNHLNNELKITTIKFQKLNQEIDDLNHRLNNFNDLYYIEKFARDHLTMKKKNETIYRVIYEEEQD